MKAKIKKSRNKTMTEQVYEKLEDMIVFCEIEPGTVLTEAEIGEMIGAGRTPVREALRILANESLVNVSRIGVIIPEISTSIQLQLLEVRRVILKLCVEKAIDRLTQIDKRKLEDLLDIVDEQDYIEFFYWLNKRHKVLAKCSKNQFLYEQLRNVQGLSHRFWYFYAKKDDHEEGKRLHKLVLEYVVKQDKEKAIDTVDELLDFLVEFTKKNTI